MRDNSILTQELRDKCMRERRLPTREEWTPVGPEYPPVFTLRWLMDVLIVVGIPLTFFGWLTYLGVASK